jgi:thiol-disulfide isomerase/thioredoxin
MNKRFVGVIMIGAFIAGSGLLLAAQRDGTANAAEPKKSAPADTKKSAPAAQGQLPSGATSAEVYGKLTTEVEALSKQLMQSTSPAEQARYYGDIEAKFNAFRKRWPNTPEANDAAFQLGAMNFGMQKYEQSTQLLKEFLGKATNDQRDQQAYARFYLAESYKGLGKYDLAQAEYDAILTRYSDINPQLTEVAKSNRSGLDTERKLAIGGEPVHFSVKSLDGKELSPAAFKGKVLLIDFWATWCGPCVKEMPNVKEVYDKYHGKGFEIVGISLDQSRDRLDKYIESNKITWPQYFDGKWWKNDVAVRYGVQSIPTTILVDRSGKIRYKSLRGKQLETAVQQLVAEKG